MKSIALCGFMGCGKTTVAKALSKISTLSVIDTDEYIVEKEKLSITRIFELYGEDYFRDKEYEAICELSHNHSCILALGGGAVTFDRNVRTLKENGYTIVFIDTDFNTIKERLINDTSRPLLKTDDIEALYNKRYKLYKNAGDIIIKCKDETSECIAMMIAKEMSEKA
ncbi:MAG: shikimate kinase [Ruminococcus sp.]|nr:shikimate kinase [Ruminococcus sp.]